jgi:nitrate reductase beta subunit
MLVRAQVAMVMNHGQVHRLPHLLGDEQAGLDEPARHGVRVVQQRRHEAGPRHPRTYEDQERWRGGWTLDRKGRLKLKAGGRATKLMNIFWTPDLPTIDDYYEPWSYDYQTLSTRRSPTRIRLRVPSRSSPATRSR